MVLELSAFSLMTDIQTDISFKVLMLSEGHSGMLSAKSRVILTTCLVFNCIYDARMSSQCTVVEPHFRQMTYMQKATTRAH